MQPNTAITAPNESPKKSAATKIIIAIIALSFAGSEYCFSQSNKTEQTMNNTTNKKEVHLVRINGLNVNIKMSVNGVVVFSENLEASVSIGAFQLNRFLVSGDNKVQITAKMIPTEYNNTSCNFVFGVVDLSVTNTISYVQ